MCLQHIRPPDVCSYSPTRSTGRNTQRYTKPFRTIAQIKRKEQHTCEETGQPKRSSWKEYSSRPHHREYPDLLKLDLQLQTPTAKYRIPPKAKLVSTTKNSTCRKLHLIYLSDLINYNPCLYILILLN